MSSRVYAIIPAGAGLTRRSRSTPFAETSASSQTSGCEMRPSQSSGTASTTASASAFWSATAFGTSSPSTTERYVRIANAMRNATVFDSGGSMSPESNGSPMAPRRIAKIVIPTCTRRDEPDRIVHEPQRRLARRDRRARARSSSRDRRPVTRAYSAATKTAFPSTRRNTMTMRREDAHAPSGAPVLGGKSSPTMIRRQYR